MIRTLRTAVVAALLLAAGNAWALGLGQIQVKSKRHQPLLAEIPIVSTTPGELAALQARLASPETFRRVGLAPPSGVAADLQFSLGSDAKGRPVIRVTTIRPIEQPVLSFLIEVDWGAGRLVREYSALMDAPNTAGATLQPEVDAPQTPLPALVQRVEPDARVPAAAANLPPSSPAPARTSAESPPPTNALPASRPMPPAPVALAPAPAPETASGAMQYGPVKPGESLSKIASGLGLRQNFSLDQTMLALLQANPEAFLGDDVNRLRSGAVLRVPTHEDVARIDADEAAQVVRQQARQWRQGRRAVRQPEVAPAADAASATAAAAPKPVPASNEKAPAAKPTAVAAAARPAPAAAAASRREEARLQIVPPTAPGKATGNKSGTSAGGEGSMLQQELRQRDEDIAAKSAEIGELKERLAALEKLKDEQQKLLSLKDSELAAVQARLAESSRAAQAKAVAAPATQATTQQAAPVEVADKGALMPWLWGGLGVVALALLAWLAGGRRKQAPPPRRSVFDSEALAAGMPASMQQDAEPAVHDETELDEAGEDAGRDAAALAAVDTAPEPRIEASIEMPSAASADTPAWHTGRMAEPAAQPMPERETVTEAVSTDADIAAAESQPAVEADLPDLAAVPAQASPEQRFKLARAFLDVGDEASAQQLLLDLLDHEDGAVSDEAARMLSKLVG